MRHDFLFEKSNTSESIRMPFSNRLIRERKAIPFFLNAKPPTVTLPRIKVEFYLKNKKITTHI